MTRALKSNQNSKRNINSISNSAILPTMGTLTSQQLMLMQMMQHSNASISKLDLFFNSISNNKIFIGFIMILLNIGGRYLSMELPKNVERFFENSWMRILIVFCISFMGTRDIKISVVITLLFILIFKFLLHEESVCCIVPKGKENTVNNNININKKNMNTESSHQSSHQYSH
jgi:hypothetical protein